ncbi:MAG: ATP synthase F1 subunit epsilon [Candidatus Brocadiales bacterium]|nr:ATP synthase F1 subunit epsilon [Candidatus Bathyanammoxibius sp.]MCQ4573953.1 ATP synthase F1 subunit epsilon [Candidatus Bathyanammoxibius amoris]
MTGENTFRLDVISPTGIQYEGDVVSVVAEGVEGSMGILHDHAPLLTWLNQGKFKIKEPGDKTVELELEGGFMEVRNNNVVVLTETKSKT